MFDDNDDELFMNVECDGEKLIENSAAVTSSTQTKVPAKVPRLTTTASKRVVYDNSSSDEDTSSGSKADRPPTQIPPKPMGIARKRNIF